LLVTVAPFLVVSWRTPNTYPMGGVRRGTATQIPRDPGQPPIDSRVNYVAGSIVGIGLTVRAARPSWLLTTSAWGSSSQPRVRTLDEGR
jgi:hypothetical protein